MAEIVEPRMLLSAASVVQPASAAGTDASGTKELVIVAQTSVGGYFPTERLRIDEIRLVGDEIRVFSTRPSSHTWPGEVYPASLEFASNSTVSVADESVASMTVIPAVAFGLTSDPVTVTVPDRELRVVHFFATVDQPQSDLYNLRTFGDSTLLYRRADADGDSGWLTTDLDPGAGSTVGLDFTPAPAAPTGLVSTSVSATSNEVTLWFDESPTSAFPGQRFVRQYNISIQSSRLAFFVPLSTELVAFDSQRFSTTDANGMVKSFGGRKTLTLPADVYSWQVQVRDLPVFPDGTTGGNALATPWSEFSETVRFAVLPPGQQILLGRTFADSSTGITTVEWGPVAGAASYEVWFNRVSDGRMVLHKTGLGGSSYQTDALDPDQYRVWVRATHANGTRTSWSKFEEFTVTPPYVNVEYSGSPVHDTTPTIKWTAIAHSIQYKISLIDTELEQRSGATWPEEVLQQFITTYTRTVTGSSSSHTVETPLPAKNYRVEITLSYSNGTKSHGTSYLNLEPAGLPIPVPGVDSLFRWPADDDAVSYDVWVTYFGQPDAISNVVPPKWKFATKDGVTSGSYHLPADAPEGNYRIWLRPNMESGGQTIKGQWSPPVDFYSAGPQSRPVFATAEGVGTVRWEPVPGAKGYRVTYDLANSWFGSRTNRHHVHDGRSTNGGVVSDAVDGTYSVWVQWLDANDVAHPAKPIPVTVEHIGSPVSWNISNDSNSISWEPIPNADLYQAYLYDLRTGNELFYKITPDTTIPVDVPAGHYRLQIRVIRYVNDKNYVSRQETKDLDLGVAAPSNIQLNGTTLTWDGPADATFSVTVKIKNGRLDAVNNAANSAGNQTLSPPISDGTPRRHQSIDNNPVPSTTFGVSGKVVDLQSYITALYSYDPTATLVVSVKAIMPNPGGSAGDNLSAVSDPVEFTLPQQPLWTNPIIETATRPKPPAPTPWAGGHNTILINRSVTLPDDDAAKRLYRTENGAAVDVEYLRRFQLRVTDLQTAVVRTFDESQISDLLLQHDSYESSVFIDDDSNVLVDVPFTGVPISLATQLRLASSVYKIEARVQYIPVILSASTYDPYRYSLTDTPPDHINVVATPWSDWSTPLEYTVLPDGQNILPISKSPGTIDPRPTFAWGSNTPNAQYELWAENRATKQRVIHETLTNVHQFQSAADLPAGQYDWWVRIVGTTGPRNGWSAKQSLEIFAPAITTSVVAETVDATPVVSWNAAGGAQSYFVTFTSTTTGKVVYQATEAAGKTSHRVTTILPNDTYSVSIQASLPNGGRTAPGAVNASGGFVLKRMTVGAAPRGVTISPSKVTWQAVDAATRYNVSINYIDSTGKTERILRQDAFGTELPLTASLTNRPGEYRVWIRAIRSEAGQEYTGRWSEFKTLQVNSPSSDAGALAIVMSELAVTGVLDGAASM